MPKNTAAAARPFCEECRRSFKTHHALRGHRQFKHDEKTAAAVKAAAAAAPPQPSPAAVQPPLPDDALGVGGARARTHARAREGDDPPAPASLPLVPPPPPPPAAAAPQDPLQAILSRLQAMDQRANELQQQLHMVARQGQVQPQADPFGNPLMAQGFGGWGQRAPQGPSQTEQAMLALLQDSRDGMQEMFQRLARLEQAKQQPAPAVATNGEAPTSIEEAQNMLTQVGTGQQPALIALPLALDPQVMNLLQEVSKIWPEWIQNKNFQQTYGEFVNSSTVAYWSGIQPPRKIQMVMRQVR